jgi:type VI secretion system protein ImpE
MQHGAGVSAASIRPQGNVMTPEELLQQGNPEAALSALQERVRAQPSVAKLRVFLFQLLCVLGQWERARTQLKVLSDLDASTLAMVNVYGRALACESLREEVFAGRRTPLILGEPLPWMAMLVEALELEAKGAYVKAIAVRAQALEQATAVPGSVDGVAFEWIADADPRLGPMCEMLIDGKYYWVPFERMELLAIEKPQDLRDVVWLPANVRLTNSGEWAALIPARYPGSEADPDFAVRLARKTVWNEISDELYHGRGLRLFATDAGEYPLAAVTRIELHHQRGA